MNKFEDILALCIDDVKSGRSNIEDCLNKYPSLREQLEPLLRIAVEIRETPDIKPSPAFKVRARVQLMEQIHSKQAVTKWPSFRYNSQIEQIPQRRRFSMASIILVIVLALSAVGGGTVYAAQDSLPGDALYTVKLGTEQMIMLLPGDDVVKAERALTFAQRRVGEMEALAERWRWQDLDLAVEKYGYALNMTLARMEQARNRGLNTGNVTARVAEATSMHLSVLDSVYDMVPEQAKDAIAHARNVSQTGYFHALAALARNNTQRAAEINLAAMLGRLNRVRIRVRNMEAMQIALQQFEDMSEFNEEISRIAQEIGLNATSLEELTASATCEHLGLLAEVWEMAPEEAQESIEQAMANLQIRLQKRIQVLEQWGVEAPQPPVMPGRIRERVEERIRQQQMREAADETTPPKPRMSSGTGSVPPCPCGKR